MNQQQTPAPLTEERLKEIADRANKATAGPWTTKPSGVTLMGFAQDVLIAATAPGKFNLVYANPPGGSYPAEDQNFIAHTRTDVPDLVAEIRRLWAKVQEQENTMAGLREELAEPIPEF